MAGERVETPAAFAAALDARTWDVILCDYRMPRFSAPAPLSIVEDKKIGTPFIVVYAKRQRVPCRVREARGRAADTHPSQARLGH